MSDANNLPAATGASAAAVADGLTALEHLTEPSKMPMSLRIWFDQPLFDKVKIIAGYLADAKGITPDHLIGNQKACFFVVEKALTWNLSPSAVAAATFVVSDGAKIGYEGKLCHAIIEASGRLAKGTGVRYEHFGPWEKVEGKFEIATSAKGRDYAKRTWTRADAAGCGVEVSAHLRGEPEPRKLRFFLTQAFPLNSTLWATDPRTQICYAAVRRFASVAAPNLIMGVPFDMADDFDEEDEAVRAARARDVSPRAPARSDPDFDDSKPDLREPASSAGAGRRSVLEGGSWVSFSRSDSDPEAVSANVESPDGVAFIIGVLLGWAGKMASDQQALDQLWDRNSPQFKFLPSALAQKLRDSWPRYTQLQGGQRSPTSAPASSESPKTGDPSQPATDQPSGAEFEVVNSDGAAIWSGSDQQEFISQLIKVAEAVAGDAQLLGGLWETHSQLIRSCRPSIRQILERRWAGLKDKASSKQKPGSERLV